MKMNDARCKLVAAVKNCNAPAPHRSRHAGAREARRTKIVNFSNLRIASYYTPFTLTR